MDFNTNSESSSPLLKPTHHGVSDHHSDSDTTETTLYDEEDTSPLPKHTQTPRRRRLLSALWALTTSLLAIYGLISLLVLIFSPLHTNQPHSPDVYRPWTLPPSLSPNCTCGPTLADALARNCTYDVLAAAFLPPHCRDPSLTQTFITSGPGPNGTWTYYADANGTVTITEAEIAAMGEKGRFWVERDWHLAHCVFYWEKYIRMRMTGSVMEERFDNVPHVRHCGKLLRKEKPKGRLLVEVEVVMDGRLDWGVVKGEHEHE